MHDQQAGQRDVVAGLLEDLAHRALLGRLRQVHAAAGQRPAGLGDALAVPPRQEDASVLDHHGVRGQSGVVVGVAQVGRKALDHASHPSTGLGSRRERHRAPSTADLAQQAAASPRRAHRRRAARHRPRPRLGLAARRRRARRGHRRDRHDRPAGLPRRGRRRAQRQDPQPRGRRAPDPRLPQPHPLLRGQGRRRRRPPRAYRGRGRLPRHRADQRLRRPQGDVRARPAGAHLRPHQPHRDEPHRGRQLRGPHRPLQPAAARAVPGDRPDARRGRLRAVPRPALRDPGRDRHGPRDRRPPRRHEHHPRGDRRPRGRSGGARHQPGHQPRRRHQRRAPQPRGGPRGGQGRRLADGRPARTRIVPRI